MGLFNFFSKSKTESGTTDNGVPGPSFLDGLTEHIAAPKKLQKHEWRRKLRTPSGQTKFKINYFGQLHHRYQNLIVGIGDLPAIVLAIEPTSGQEILLFDGCRHGYNAMFCDNYSQEQRTKRTADTVYKTANGNDTFELTISTYNGIDYEDEFSDEVGEDGLIEIIDGTKVEFETVKRNGFGALHIVGTTESGETIEIVSEELA
ncbi:MAG: hypothetical protein HYZ51_03315 [Candidatus Doudnabacteria bacterium]|nr:hypothetical protein [Candidatus Doudnabacteria bacterium]